MPNTQNISSHQPAIHVLHIASGDLWAGAEVMLYTLAKCLHEELDTQVTVITLNHGTLEQKLRNRGIPVIVLNESQLNAFQILRHLSRHIARIKPDVIHTHRSKENILGSIAARLNHGIPSLRTVHGAQEIRPPFYKPAKYLVLLLDALAARYLQKTIVAVSPDLSEKLAQHFSKTKIKVIENGIELGARQDVPSKTYNNNKYQIGIAGRLVTVKRVDLFIECAVYLKQHHPELNIDFHIYGDGPLHNTLQKQVTSLQADSYINLHGHCENIVQQLQMLDALLMTSDHEGLPMILLEAMSKQTTIIAHATGGIPNLLEQGKCGVLVHQHTAKAYAQAILHLTNQPERQQILTARALTRVTHFYSARHMASAYLNSYKQIID